MLLATAQSAYMYLSLCVHTYLYAHMHARDIAIASVRDSITGIIFLVTVVIESMPSGVYVHTHAHTNRKSVLGVWQLDRRSLPQ
eukprot:14708836-Alexandrium_andersonii.AAC.1